MEKKMISFEGSDELKEELRILAFKKRTTISALIRDILKQAIKKANDEKMGHAEIGPDQE